MVENDMQVAIVKWLNRSGYYDAHECLIGGYCDVVGCIWGDRIGRRKPKLLEMICVELKMKDISGVISQAKGNHYHSNLSFCAMPGEFCQTMRNQSIQNFIDSGVGLLSVEGESVKIIISSRYKNRTPDVTFRNRLWAFKLRHKNRRAVK